MTLQQLIVHFFGLYGPRNSLFLQSPNDRVGFLAIAVGDLQEAVRKNYLDKMEIALARLVSRIFCLAECFRSISLVEALTEKYPAGHCSFCGQIPCTCQERRPEARLEKPNQQQLGWTLRQWQEHLASMYGGKNKGRGIENIINRLFKEVTEILSLLMIAGSSGSNLSKLQHELALELADALAWTIAAANFFEVDIEKTLLARYGNGCWKCGQSPCRCGQFNFAQVDWLSVQN